MRSKLFMPGDKPDAFPGALAAMADMVSIDLEDTVTPANKDLARRLVVDLVQGLDKAALSRVLVRVNSLESGLALRDLDALVGTGVTLFNIPKPESAEDVRQVSAHIDQLEGERGIAHGTCKLLLNVESPRGMRSMFEVASASDRTAGLQIGYADLLEPYSIDREFEPALDHIRMAVKLVAAEVGVAVYDGVYAGVSNDEFFRQECIRAHRLGFAGKSCFNAAQVAIANEVFQPTPEQVMAAERIVSTAAQRFADGDGLYMLDGRIVDQPFVDGARKILERARAVQQMQGKAASA